MRHSLWVVLMFAGASQAAPRMMSVAVGDCTETGLVNASRLFSDALSGRLEERVLDAEAISDRLKPRALKSPEEIHRQLASAQTQFYNLQYAKANQQLEAAISEIERLQPGTARWALFQAAHLLSGTVQLAANQKREAEESFRRILALNPTFELDADYYAPSTRALFDKVRAQVTSEKKGNLHVRSNPPGSEVYLDGRLVGKTPLSGRFPPSRYQVIVARNPETASFPRTLTLTNTSSVHVDLEFEGSVKPGNPVCLSGAQKTPDRLAHAVKIGALLDVEEVVLISVRRQSAAAQWLTATLVSVRGGHEVREAGLKMEDGGPVAGLDDLVSFIATGQATPNVIVKAQDAAAAPWGAVSGAATQRPKAQDAGARLAVAQASAVKASSPRPPSGARVWAPAVAGGVLLGSGTALYVMAHNSAAALRTRDPSVVDHRQTIARGRLFEGLGFGLGAAGFAALGTAAVLHFTDRPSAPTPQVSVVPVNQGAVAGVAGTW